MQGKTFTVGKHTYTIYYSKGQVAGKDKNFETQVYGGGGGGGSYQGTGGSAPISISSRTVIHDKIYLKQENGKEEVVELTNWDVACREGHELMVMWLIRSGNERGPYVAIKNFTTNQFDLKESALLKLAGQKPSGLLFFFGGLKFTGVFLAVLFLLLLIRMEWILLAIPYFTTVVALVGIGYSIFSMMKANTEITNRVNQFKAEIKSFVAGFQ